MANGLQGWTSRIQVFEDVAYERDRQDVRWGEQNHSSGTGAHGSREAADRIRKLCDARDEAGILSWMDILDEEIAEAYAESDPERLREELVQVAAVVVAWIECLDRRA